MRSLVECRMLENRFCFVISKNKFIRLVQGKLVKIIMIAAFFDFERKEKIYTFHGRANKDIPSRFILYFKKVGLKSVKCLLY